MWLQVKNIWDIVKSINTHKSVLDDPDLEEMYNSWVINRNMAQFPDTIMFANELNQYADIIPDKQQYLYLFHSIRPGKRFAKKQDVEYDEKVIKFLSETYDINTTRALEVASLLSKAQVEYLMSLQYKGGINNDKRKPTE